MSQGGAAEPAAGLVARDAGRRLPRPLAAFRGAALAVEFRGAPLAAGLRGAALRAGIRGAALAVGLLVLALAVAGCDMPSTGGLGQVQGSGQPVTRTYDLTGFTRLETDSGFRVTVRQGEEYAVSVTVDDNLVEEHLEVEPDGDTLRIGLAPLWNYLGVSATATVTLPSLQGVEASGAASVDASGFASGDPLAVELSGGSTLMLADVRAGEVTADLSGASRLAGELEALALAGEASGASTVELRGSGGGLRLDASGGSRLSLSGLEVDDADLELSGGSQGAVHVTGTLHVDASGGSRLEYSGSPRLGSIDSSGGSVIEPAGQ